MGERMRADLSHRDVAIRVRRNIEEHVREISRQRFAKLSGRIRQPIRAAARRRLFDRACIRNDFPLFGYTHHESQLQLTAADHRAFFGYAHNKISGARGSRVMPSMPSLRDFPAAAGRSGQATQEMHRTTISCTRQQELSASL